MHVAGLVSTGSCACVTSVAGSLMAQYGREGASGSRMGYQAGQESLPKTYSYAEKTEFLCQFWVVQDFSSLVDFSKLSTYGKADAPFISGHPQDI